MPLLFSLAPEGGHFYFYGMKRCLLICIGLSFLTFWTTRLTAQDAAAEAALIAERKAAEERSKRLEALLEDMKEAYEAQQKRLMALAEEINRLREETARAGNNLATREELRKLAEKIQEVDQKREADKELILKELQKLAKAPPPLPVEHKASAEGNADVPDKFFTHVVKQGEYLSTIISAFNAELKAKGKGTVTLSQVKKANPNLNPDNLKVGQEILIPVPPNK